MKPWVLCCLLMSTCLGAAPPCGAEEETEVYHVVAADDTLLKIAMMYAVSPRALREVNNLTGDTLTVGQELRIPAADSRQAGRADEDARVVTGKGQRPDAPPPITGRQRRTMDRMRILAGVRGIVCTVLLAVMIALCIRKRLWLLGAGFFVFALVGLVYLGMSLAKFESPYAAVLVSSTASMFIIVGYVLMLIFLLKFVPPEERENWDEEPGQ